MTSFQIKRLIRLDEKADRNWSEYRRFSTDPSTQSKALCHLRKAERLYSQISYIIRDSTGKKNRHPENGNKRPAQSSKWEPRITNLPTLSA